MNTVPTTLFDGLESTDYARLEHAHSLKGLLKPFKDKGELSAWANQCEALRDQLMRLSLRLLQQTHTYPLNLLPAALVQQKTEAGTAFLRWRSNDRSAMGDSLLARLLSSDTTPAALTAELIRLETQRIALNMQISLTNSIARQARECVDKISRLPQVRQIKLQE